MAALIPGTKEFMEDCNFWLEKIQNANSVIMTKDDIKEFNKKMLKNVDSIHDIKEYPKELDKEALISIIKKYSIPDEIRFDINGEIIKEEFYTDILENRNMDGIKTSNEIRFGIAVRNARIRSFPTDGGCFDEKDYFEFDLIQENECQAIEPVAILHTSLDGEWFYVQMYNYIGWVKSSDIAVAQCKKELFDYLETDQFLVVTGNRVSTHFNHYDSRVSCKDYYMGTRIPMVTEDISQVGNQATAFNHVVKLPVRDNNGNLEFVNALFSRNEDVSYGYLAYTRENILRQAFKLQGDRYDWGNKNNGRDCSSFIMYVYKTMGLVLPRNADEQENGEGIKYKLEDSMDISKRSEIINKTEPGAAIFMKGHVMMYIGEVDGEPFMIHDFHRYGIQDGEKLIPCTANEVAVTSTMLLSSKGKKFIEAFTSLVQYENMERMEK